MENDLGPDGVNLIDGAFDGYGTRDAAGNPDREKDTAEAAFAHARDVNIAVLMARSQIKIRVKKKLGGVVVRVNHERTEMKFAGPLRDLHLIRGSDEHERNQDRERATKRDNRHASHSSPRRI